MKNLILLVLVVISIIFTSCKQKRQIEEFKESFNEKEMETFREILDIRNKLSKDHFENVVLFQYLELRKSQHFSGDEEDLDNYLDSVVVYYIIELENAAHGFLEYMDEKQDSMILAFGKEASKFYLELYYRLLMNLKHLEGDIIYSFKRAEASSFILGFCKALQCKKQMEWIEEINFEECLDELIDLEEINSKKNKK
jgi:hypothetical protein